MYASLLYKEYREHRAIWLTFALLGAGVLLGVPYFFQAEAARDPEFYRIAMGIVAIVLAWAYGIVCGAMLFASEREGGTHDFLDSLPASRRKLWLGKVLAGAIFVFCQIVVLGGIACNQVFFPSKEPILGPLLLAYFGVVGFGWGALSSALSSNVLRAIGLAMVVQNIAAPVFIIPMVIVLFFFVLVIEALHFDARGIDKNVLQVIAGLLYLLVPFALSKIFYTRNDRGRLLVRSAAGSKLDSLISGWPQLLWLSWRQTRWQIVGLIVFSLLVGIPAIAKGLYVWPFATLLIGAFCGVANFLDEQSGAYRFLGDQRFPLGRIWLVKVGLRLFVVFFCAFLALVPAIIALLVSHENHLHGEEELFAGSALIEWTIPIGPFLLLWPCFGYALGTLCGLLFRKAIVALVVAGGLGVLLVAPFVPSLVLGGLHLWQVMGIPVVLLSCSLLLVKNWAADRLLSWRTAFCLAATGILCAGLIALGLWYRIVEFPNTPEPDDFPAFVAGFPTPEENKAGRLIHTAYVRLNAESKEWPSHRRPEPRLQGLPLTPLSSSDFIADCDKVLVQGWPDGDRELADWLDDVFAKDWWKPLVEASHESIGVVDDPRQWTNFYHWNALGRTIAKLLLARGLQLQKTKGDPTAFVDQFAVTISLIRNMQNHAPSSSVLYAQNIETLILDALAVWLGELEGRPDLLARVAGILHQYRQAVPRYSHDRYLADYLIALNVLDQPQEWLSLIGLAGRDQNYSDDSGLLTAFWTVPWESERRLRMLRAFYWGDLDTRSLPVTVIRLVPVQFNRRRWQNDEALPRRLVRLGIAELMIALRRYQADTGKPAERLDLLLPKYLERLPQDPFDSQPLRYRLSRGEEIEWPSDDGRELSRNNLNANLNAYLTILLQNQPLAAAACSGCFLPVHRHFGGVASGGAAGSGPAQTGGGPGNFPFLAAPPVRKVPAGQGILWSVGEDGHDDGGKRQGLLSNQRKTMPGQDLIFLVPLPARKKP